MKIDLVYLWVDGNDAKWLEKKNSYIPKDKQLPKNIVSNCQNTDNGELKYSLRSVEKFASWINHIYIITDNQIPDWLDVTNNKISIIDHKEIIPEDCLPCYNSCAIELFLHKIPGLSEHFLYSNDDMFFGQKVTPDFFYDSKGLPKVRLHKQKIKGSKGNYQQQVYTAQMKIKELTGKYYKLAPHHNIDAMRCSDMEELNSLLSKDIIETSHHRFRHSNDLQRIAYSYFVLAKYSLKYIKVTRYNGCKNIFESLKCFFSGRFSSDSRCISLNSGDLQAVFNKYNPKVFALNDGKGVEDEHRAKLQPFMESMFPNKSQFEK